MKQWFFKIKDKHVILSFMLLILFFSLKYISQLTVPTFLNDEFGYLANAALLTGKNWSGITRISAYYSYGYSLVLVPLFLLIKNTAYLYKAIILLNICFYLISYFISFITIKDLFKKIDTRIIAFVCGIVALYGTNIYNVNYAWVEPLIYLIFWVLIYQLNQIYKKGKMINIILFAFLLCYIYMIHQRTIGVVLTGCFCILCLVCNKKIDKKQGIVFVLAIVLFMMVGILVKNYIHGCLWSHAISEKVAKTNSYGGQLSKILAIIQSPQLLWNLFKGMIGKYYYLLISTGSLITFGIIKVLKEIKNTFKSKKEINVVFVFMLFSLMSLIVTSSIFFVAAERFDTLLYGRYSEFAMLPLFIIGILSFINKEFSIKECILNGVIFIVCYLSVRGFLSGTRSYIFPCTINASLFYVKEVQEFAFNKYFVVGIVLSSITYLLMTRKQLILKVIPFALLIGFWNMNVSSAMEQDKLLAQKHILQIQEVVEAISKDKPIYYVYDGNYDYNYPHWFIDDIQYMLPNKTILLTNTKEVNKLTNCYVITYEDQLDKERYTYITDAINYYLYEN